MPHHLVENNAVPPSGYVSPPRGIEQYRTPSGFTEKNVAPPSGFTENNAAPPSGFTENNAAPPSGFTENNAAPPSGFTDNNAAPPSGFRESNNTGNVAGEYWGMFARKCMHFRGGFRIEHSGAHQPRARFSWSSGAHVEQHSSRRRPDLCRLSGDDRLAQSPDPRVGSRPPNGSRG